MPANMSLILNLLLLTGIVVAIIRLVRQRRQSMAPDQKAEGPSLGLRDGGSSDDIIAVRKVQILEADNEESSGPVLSSERPGSAKPSASPVAKAHAKPKTDTTENEPVNNPLMIFLSAKKNRQFAGYELLQALLASGLRFGDGNLFHRHQGDNGQGILMCSLAAATATGQFNLSRMGAFACRGLCLFLEPSLNSSIDQERFLVMHEIAEQLNEELDAVMLDEKNRPFDEESLKHYEKRLGCELDIAVVN